jgi:hypothetical protein
MNFDRSCIVIDFEEAISKNKNKYCKINLLDENGKMHKSLYFAYSPKSDKKILSEEYVFQIKGEYNDGLVKINDITVLDNPIKKYSDFKLISANIESEKNKLLKFIKENITEKKYFDLIKSIILKKEVIFKMLNLNYSPYYGVNGGLVEHINNCLYGAKSKLNLYRKYEFIIDEQAIYTAIILKDVCRLHSTKKGVLYVEDEFNNKIGDGFVSYNIISKYITDIKDYFCLFDILKYVWFKNSSRTLESRIFYNTIYIDNIMLSVKQCVNNMEEVTDTICFESYNENMVLNYPSKTQ